MLVQSLSSSEDVTARYFDDAHDGLEQRRLARPVGSDDGGDLALLHLERHVVDDGRPAVTGGEFARREVRRVLQPMFRSFVVIS